MSSIDLSFFARPNSEPSGSSSDSSIDVVERIFGVSSPDDVLVSSSSRLSFDISELDDQDVSESSWRRRWFQ